ncbi:carbohydrate ABC transporter ATP-binding protein (CUT1 family) [Yoonia maricola]|uniref:Carbohydrate ABC transporter ATP-binding protein (CUT1 family) n=1 Tax=Yoonia maricola TaxID=420999 RepID=A0A2M8WLW1_9RHOB|nr:sn-glycerol-3-phosphate ABC transporter ATP-binding protein UgpC [Yoonia maricola]PJI91866.1 carbohydrate ABC transporter ATP-binding protein (CUT1 family) [Yoonia maricola]
MADVSITALDKTYGTFDVLHGVSFDVADGEFIALVGPSGCGKSTLLRMIAGLEDITGGSIAIGGRVMNDVAPKERDIAMVFQNYALYPHMTVAQNMGFSLRLHGAPKAKIAERVAKAADVLGLIDYLDRMPGQLSGGQRQRVAMGRAIVRQPQVFLFDEPLSNLDAALRVQMRAEIRNLHDRLGSTSIFVTHDQIEAMTMADRIAVLRDGCLEQVGRPLDIYDYPANAFVAGFIGSPAMNIVPAHAAEHHVTFGSDVRVPVNNSYTGPVQWGIRPEHFELVPAETPDAIAAVAQRVESTGSDEFVMTAVGDVRFDAQLANRPGVKQGDQIWLRPDPAKSHLFDVQSGVRLT